jgi:hypothetical protein
MSPNLYVLLDGALSFGAALAFCVWQLKSTARAKRERIAREQAQKDSRGEGD